MVYAHEIIYFIIYITFRWAGYNHLMNTSRPITEDYQFYRWPLLHWMRSEYEWYIFMAHTEAL